MASLLRIFPSIFFKYLQNAYGNTARVQLQLRTSEKDTLGFSERLELGVTLKETSSRWTNFAGRRCLLEPGEHAGREIEIAWRTSDHPRDCSLIPKLGKPFKVVANTYYTIVLAAKPELFIGGNNPVAIFH